MYQFFHLVTRVRPDQCLRPCPSENRPSFAKVGLAARGRWGRTQSCGRRPRRPVRARTWLILWARSGPGGPAQTWRSAPQWSRRYLTDKKLDEASRMPATRSVSTTTRAHGIALKFKRRILFLPSPSSPTSGSSYVPTHSAALPSRMAFYPPSKNRSHSQARVAQRSAGAQRRHTDPRPARFAQVDVVQRQIPLFDHIPARLDVPRVAVVRHDERVLTVSAHAELRRQGLVVGIAETPAHADAVDHVGQRPDAALRVCQRTYYALAKRQLRHHLRHLRFHRVQRALVRIRKPEEYQRDGGHGAHQRFWQPHRSHQRAKQHRARQRHALRHKVEPRAETGQQYTGGQQHHRGRVQGAHLKADIQYGARGPARVHHAPEA